MASTTTLANNFLLPGPPVLTQLRLQPCIPLPLHLVCSTPWCAQLGTLVCCPQFSCPGILPPPLVPLPPPSLQANSCTEAPVQHLCLPQLPLLPGVGVSCLPPKASLGFEGSGFAYKQKCSTHTVPLQNASFPSAKLHIKSESRLISVSNMKTKNFQNIWRISLGKDGTVVSSQD